MHNCKRIHTAQQYELGRTASGMELHVKMLQSCIPTSLEYAQTMHAEPEASQRLSLWRFAVGHLIVV